MTGGAGLRDDRRHPAGEFGASPGAEVGVRADQGEAHAMLERGERVLLPLRRETDRPEEPDEVRQPAPLRAGRGDEENLRARDVPGGAGAGVRDSRTSDGHGAAPGRTVTLYAVPAGVFR